MTKDLISWFLVAALFFAFGYGLARKKVCPRYDFVLKTHNCISTTEPNVMELTVYRKIDPNDVD